MKRKFNTSFDNIIEISDLRGEYELTHYRIYITKEIHHKNARATGKITKENNKIRNLKRYKRVDDLFEFRTFGKTYEIQLTVNKSTGFPMFSVTSVDEKGEEPIFTDIMCSRFMSDELINYVYIKDKELLDVDSKIILKDSMGNRYEIYHESKCAQKYDMNKCIGTYMGEELMHRTYSFDNFFSNDEEPKVIKCEQDLLKYDIVIESYYNEFSILIYQFVTSTMLSTTHIYVMIDDKSIFFRRSNLIPRGDNDTEINNTYAEEIDNVVHLYIDNDSFGIVNDINITDGFGNRYVIHRYSIKNKLQIIK